jgi:comEA protein
MEEGKQIRILICIAVLFCALMIGFHLFFVQEPAATIVVTDLSSSETVSSAASEGAATNSTKININTATAEELETLPQIGATRAARIVEYRESYGPFQTIEEIKNVSGIGEVIFSELKDLIEVD